LFDFTNGGRFVVGEGGASAAAGVPPAEERQDEHQNSADDAAGDRADIAVMRYD